MWKYEPFLLPHTAPTLKAHSALQRQSLEQLASRPGLWKQLVNKKTNNQKKTYSISFIPHRNFQNKPDIKAGELVALAGSRSIGSGPQMSGCRRRPCLTFFIIRVSQTKKEKATTETKGRQVVSRHRASLASERLLLIIYWRDNRRDPCYSEFRQQYLVIKCTVSTSCQYWLNILEYLRHSEYAQPEEKRTVCIIPDVSSFGSRFCNSVAQRWLPSFLARLPVCRTIDRLYLFGFSADEVRLCLVASGFSRPIPTAYFFFSWERQDTDFQSESDIRACEQYVEWIPIMWLSSAKKCLYNTAF